MNTNHRLRIKKFNWSTDDIGNLTTNQTLPKTISDDTNETLFFIRPAIINNGVCFETRNGSVFMELDNPCSETDCFFAVWIKYLCELNSETLIFNTPFLSLWCYSTPDYNLTRTVNYSKVRVHIDSCSMLINAKNGFWFHFAYIRKNEQKEVFIDGEQVEIDEDCDIPVTSNANEFIVAKSRTPTCIDEIVLSKILPSFDSVRERIFRMYNLTFYGRCFRSREVTAQSHI